MSRQYDNALDLIIPLRKHLSTLEIDGILVPIIDGVPAGLIKYVRISTTSQVELEGSIDLVTNELSVQLQVVTKFSKHASSVPSMKISREIFNLLATFELNDDVQASKIDIVNIVPFEERLDSGEVIIYRNIIINIRILN